MMITPRVSGARLLLLALGLVFAELAGARLMNPLWSPGTFLNGSYYTDSPTDLAVLGEGYFILRDPVSGRLAYTREGEFYFDGGGYLSSVNGFRVQGYSASQGQELVDMRVSMDSAWSPWGNAGEDIVAFSFGSNGVLSVLFADAGEIFSGQLALQSFSSEQMPQRIRRHLLALPVGVQPFSSPARPGESGAGLILSRVLEAVVEPVRLALKPSLAASGLLEQGVPTQTGGVLDLAINGPGFFLVREVQTSELFATRAGLFQLDKDRYITTYDGKRLQGLAQSGDMVSGDLRLDLPPPDLREVPWENYVGHEIQSDGELVVFSELGTIYGSGRIQVFTFENPQRLAPVPLGQWSGVRDAGPVAQHLSDGLEKIDPGIRPGFLEMNQVPQELRDLRKAMPNLLQGSIRRTGVPTELAINGPGFFLLRDPNSEELFATRDGRFFLDEQKYLVNRAGLRVQGWGNEEGGRPGDVRWILDESPELTPDFYAISQDGRIHWLRYNGWESVVGTIGLQLFLEPHRLRANASGVFTNLSEAHPEDSWRMPGTAGAGSIQSGALELPPSALEFPGIIPRDARRLCLTGEAGALWELQASPDLIHWETVQVISNAPEELELAEPEAGPGSMRFYRVLQAVPR